MDRFLVFFLSLFICSCNGQVDKKETISVNELDKKIEKYNYKHNKKIFYGMSISAFASVEVFVDDILVARKETLGNLSFGIELNDWVLNNGDTPIKLDTYLKSGTDYRYGFRLRKVHILYYTWYMDKNRPLPPGSAFDAYREADFSSRKAEGFPVTVVCQ